MGILIDSGKVALLNALAGKEYIKERRNDPNYNNSGDKAVLRAFSNLEAAALEPVRCKKIAIGTGVGGIVALVAAVTAVALAILFPPLGLALFCAAAVAGAAFLALGIASVVHGAKAAKLRVRDKEHIMAQLTEQDQDLIDKNYGLQSDPLFCKKKLELMLNDRRFRSLKREFISIRKKFGVPGSQVVKFAQLVFSPWLNDAYEAAASLISRNPETKKINNDIESRAGEGANRLTLSKEALENEEIKAYLKRTMDPAQRKRLYHFFTNL